jgi:putative transcriptional regulator
VPFEPAHKITPKELAKVRESMNLSRDLSASYLRTNAGTLEEWEQGRAKPKAQAALLIRLLQRFPDTIGRLHGM